jgi:hypothetical protein
VQSSVEGTKNLQGAAVDKLEARSGTEEEATPAPGSAL